ncbi:MAG: MraY family glycosyltransferase [Candidatus Omnitrophota bacterium]
MVDYKLPFFTFCIALGAAYLLTPICRRIAFRTGVLSKVNERTVHKKPIPYLGGVAIYIAFFVAVLFVFFVDRQFNTEFLYKLKGLILGSTLIVMLGLWDDIRDISPIIKFIGQILIGLLLFKYGFRIENVTNPFFGGEIHLPLLLSASITVLWIVTLVNAMNIIDGLDGLAAGIVFIVAISLILVSFFLGNYVNIFLLAALAGCTLGFLKYNFYPAKIFMGDSGSMFIGLILALIALMESQYKSATAVVLLIPITALTIPMYDTFIAIVRRISNKGSIFKADKLHLHHRLLSMGLKQKQIVLFMYLATLYLGIFSFLFILISQEYALILLILLALWLFMGVRIIGFIERRMNKK